jgi:hypothetical protein
MALVSQFVCPPRYYCTSRVHRQMSTGLLCHMQGEVITRIPVEPGECILLTSLFWLLLELCTGALFLWAAWKAMDM